MCGATALTIDTTMNNEELLYEYLDGGLDELREAVLFAALAHDPLLRRELSDYMQLRTVARNEAAAAVPPVALTAAVFGNLGYQVAPTQSAAAFASSPADDGAAPTAGTLSLLFPYIATSVLSSLVTALVVVLLLRPWSMPAGKAESQPVVPPAQSAVMPEYTSPVVQAVPDVVLRAPSTAVQHTAQRLRPSVVQSDAALLKETLLENTETPVSAMPVGGSAISAAAIRTDERNAIALPTADVPPEAVELSLADADFRIVANSELRLDVEVLSASLQDISAIALPDHLNNTVVPFSVSALYLLSDEHAVGVEIGRESFAQEFRQTIGSDTATVRQNPVLWWSAASYRYAPEVLRWNSFTPFARVALGGTVVGPVGRIQCGVAWTPESRIMLSTGVSANALVYSVDGSVYTSAKAGLFYGVRVRF